MAERYCVPTSLPWRMPCVGSCPSQKMRSISMKLVLAGSHTTSTASVWPVLPEQTSWYVGFGV